jgi:hypothetical protein
MTGGSRITIDGVCDVALADATTVWRDAIPAIVDADVPQSD